MNILAVGFAGELLEDATQVASFSASYQRMPLNPFHDYFIVEIFTPVGQLHYNEAIVPKTSQFQREDGVILQFARQLTLAANPQLTHTIETHLVIDGSSDNHVYVTRDFVNHGATARVWQAGTHLYDERVVPFGSSPLTIGQQLGYR